MHRFNRIFLIVLDSFGVGAMPDAATFDDEGADTFGNIWRSQNGLNIPNLLALGLGEISSLHLQNQKEGRCLRLFEKSNGKDTMTGHWEMMGVETKTPFKTFTEHGFPEELIQELEVQFGRKIVGNKASSGTQILDELAEEEIYNGKIIVYTSADSVLQIPGNEETMGLETLYHYCQIARKITLADQWKVGRVIARPYRGKKKGEFIRTSNRKDFSLAPPFPTALDVLADQGFDVIGIGKIGDIFSGKGITETLHSCSSAHGMQQTIEVARQRFTGLCFTNLVDFDALWGHRRDPKGYGKELEDFDSRLGDLLALLDNDDLLLITADHGNDPTYKGTDHTREMVPLLAYSHSMAGKKRLNDQDSFGAIGASIADNFGLALPNNLIGSSILHLL